MSDNIGPESGPDVTSAMFGGYPTVGAPATGQQAAPETAPATTEPPAGAEKPQEGGQAATGGGAAQETKTEPPAESARRTDYATMDVAQLREEIAKRDREILSSEYGVLNLKSTHKQEMAALQNAATFLELASKDTEPERAIEFMIEEIAKSANTSKDAILARLGAKATGRPDPAAAAQTVATDLKFATDDQGRQFFEGDDRQFVDGIVGAVMSQVRQALQGFSPQAPQDPLLKSLLAREQEAQKQAELHSAAEGSAELVQKAAALKYPGLELSREEAIEAAKYKLSHPNMDFDDAVFLVHKEKVKDHLLGKKTAAKGPEELPRGGSEHLHGNPPTNGRADSVALAEILAGYPTL